MKVTSVHKMFNTDLSGSAVMVVLLGVWHPGLSTVRMWLSRRLCLRSASSSLIVTPLKRPLLLLAVVVFTGVFTSGDKPWSIGEAKLPAPWTYLLPLPEGIGVTVLTDSPLAKVLLTVLDMLAWIVPIRSSAVITVKLDWMRCGVAHVVIYKLTPQSTQQRQPSLPSRSPGQQVQMSSWRQISQLHDSQYPIPFGMGTECACTQDGKKQS